MFIDSLAYRFVAACRINSKKICSSVQAPEFIRRRSKMDENMKCRENPVVMKLQTKEFKNILTEDVLTLKSLFDKYNFEIRVAGGAVRDLLMGKQPTDLDFATTATPLEMKEMFTKEEVRLINLNGEKHGTITPRINDRENFEVTTLRVDMVTDGRHAEVEFTKDWKLDANRRDLTINSMFLGFDGSVYDYFYGYEDLLKKRVAFVGDPEVRIKEDYLRILRYFRFYGRISDHPNKHEAQTLEIIKRNVNGLKIISGERIWMELKKILQGNYPGDILKTMISVDIAKYIGLPSEPDMQELDKVLNRSQNLACNPMVYLAALLQDVEEATALKDRLKFSSYDRNMLYFIIDNRQDKICVKPLLPYQKMVVTTKMKKEDLKEYLRELFKYRGDRDLLEEFDKWEIPKFPINGTILKNNGIAEGKLISRILNKLTEVWAESDFKLNEEELVALLPSIMKDVNIKGKKAK